jgi:hypothetical protein
MAGLHSSSRVKGKRRINKEFCLQWIQLSESRKRGEGLLLRDTAGRRGSTSLHPSDGIVVIKSQVSDLLFSHEVAQGIFQFHQLNEKIMLRIEVGSTLWALEIE